MLSHIIIQNASLSFDKAVLFKNFNIRLRGNVWSCFLGPSGIGKSSLLKIIAQLIPKSANLGGEVFTEPFIDIPNNIAYMAQKDLLLPWLNVLDNTLLSARLTGTIDSIIKDRARELLDKVGLANSLLKFPHELSGGMRQRVALARTLIQDKPIILMDEPFSGVDAITRFELQTLAVKLLKNHTILFITHDPQEALRLAHDIYVLSGCPVSVSNTIYLASAIPRNASDPECITHQAELFSALVRAKENAS